MTARGRVIKPRCRGDEGCGTLSQELDDARRAEAVGAANVRGRRENLTACARVADARADRGGARESCAVSRGVLDPPLRRGVP